MPSGPRHWLEFWGDDSRALEYLRERGFRHEGGVFFHPERPQDWDELDILDKAALMYLSAEWDYSYARTSPQRTLALPVSDDEGEGDTYTAPGPHRASAGF